MSARPGTVAGARRRRWTTFPSGPRFIALDAVLKRSGTRAFVNVPMLVVGRMPWSEPPSTARQDDTLGRRAAQVTKAHGPRSPSALERLWRASPCSPASSATISGG